MNNTVKNFAGKLGFAALTAVVTILAASGISTLSGQGDLANRVDRNAAITSSGVAAIVCILNFDGDPADRTDAFINACLDANGFHDVVNPAKITYEP